MPFSFPSLRCACGLFLPEFERTETANVFVTRCCGLRYLLTLSESGGRPVLSRLSALPGDPETQPPRHDTD